MCRQTGSAEVSGEGSAGERGAAEGGVVERWCAKGCIKA